MQFNAKLIGSSTTVYLLESSISGPTLSRLLIPRGVSFVVDFDRLPFGHLALDPLRHSIIENTIATHESIVAARTTTPRRNG